MPSSYDSDSDTEENIRCSETVSRQKGRDHAETRDDRIHNGPVDRQDRIGSQYSLLRCLAWSQSEGTDEVETEGEARRLRILMDSHDQHERLPIGGDLAFFQVSAQGNLEERESVPRAVPPARVLSEHRLPSDKDLSSHFQRLGTQSDLKICSYKYN
jgi:hypothetical protein